MPPEATARARGFRPLTHPFKDSESLMYRNTLRDLKGCNIVIVPMALGVEIWRDGRELKKTPEQP
jgi:hypothetical protein